MAAEKHWVRRVRRVEVLVASAGRTDFEVEVAEARQMMILVVDEQCWASRAQ